MLSAAKNTLIDEKNRLTLIDFDIASLYEFPRTDQLLNRQYRPQSYAELLTEFYGDGKLTLIDFDIATLFGFPRTRELVDRRELDQKSYADLLTELHGEVCTANTGAAARAAEARARWNRPVT